MSLISVGMNAAQNAENTITNQLTSVANTPEAGAPKLLDASYHISKASEISGLTKKAVDTSISNSGAFVRGG
jgi:aspartate ammonia-lyase